ncbi:MAG: hypothetical protein DMF63_17700 [Acidobacteria bacterium]|nr:MAG: hypothetical protein DMF63_17700 [Acidobacteriota bacterium]
MRKGFLFKFAFAAVLFGVACGVNSVTKAQLEAVKPGDVLVYRYQKEGKSWFYADKITKIEGDKIYFNPSQKEGTAGNDERLKAFDTSREVSMTKADLLKYETEQGDERKVIIWINP